MARRRDLAQEGVGLAAQLGLIAEQLKALARVQDALRKLYISVLGRDAGLEAVLRQVVVAAMDLVDAQYGALGVLNEDGDELTEFVAVGLTEEEEAAAAPLGLPRGRGALAHLMADPRPLRLDSISDHPLALGLPPGHPPVRTLLGVGIKSSGGRTYGNLYVSDRRDGQPFDEHDELMIGTLAGAASLAIDDARLFGQVRSESEEFQAMLLPQLPDLRPIEAAALYRPAAVPGRIGGDWYDALRLPDDTCLVVIGDIGGHGVRAAAAMAQTRSMLRALLYEHYSPPSAILAQLDRTLQAVTDTPFSTACLARVWPAGFNWCLEWSTAGHLAPLVLVSGEAGRYLDAEPGLPLCVAQGIDRPDQCHWLVNGTTVVFFTDGLVEHHAHPIDEGLASLARIAADHADLPPEQLCNALVEHQPGDGSDDIAILALRLPACPRSCTTMAAAQQSI